jgi:hypothetical protein
MIVRIKDFSLSPGPRYINQGSDSGEQFYCEVLKKQFVTASISNAKIVIDLDGVNGYLSSFLDEVFGRLVFDFGKDEVCSRLSITSKEEPSWIAMIEDRTYPEWEKRRKMNSINKPLYDC